MKGVLVLEVDLKRADDIQGWMNEVHDFAFPKDDPPGPDDPKFRGLHVAIKEDAEMVLDIFKTPELGGGKHFAVVDVHGEWVIEHSIICRRSGKMTECPYIDLVRESVESEQAPVGTAHYPKPGRFQVQRDFDQEDFVHWFELT